MDKYCLDEVKHRVYELMEGGDLSIIFDEIKLRIALEIANSNPEEVETRNEKYQLIRGVKELEKQLRSYVNDIVKLKENEDGRHDS